MTLRLTWKTVLAMACCVAISGCAPFRLWSGSKANPGGPAARTASKDNLDDLIEAAPPAQERPQPTVTPSKSSFSFFKGDSDKKKVADEAEVDRQLAVARLGERRGESEGARNLYKKIAEQHPQHPAAFHRLGILEARESNFNDANRYFDHALQLGNPSLDLLSDFGYCLYLQNRFDEAERILRQSQRQKPNHEATCNNLGLVLGAQGRYADALEMFQRVNPEAEAYANLAYCFTQTGDLDNAKKGYVQALTLDKKLRQAALAVIQVEERLKQQEQLKIQADKQRALQAAAPAQPAPQDMPPRRATPQFAERAEPRPAHRAPLADVELDDLPPPEARIVQEAPRRAPVETQPRQPAYIQRDAVAEVVPERTIHPQAEPALVERHEEEVLPPLRSIVARPSEPAAREPAERTAPLMPQPRSAPSASSERPLFVMPSSRKPSTLVDKPATPGEKPAPKVTEPQLIPRETTQVVSRPEPKLERPVELPTSVAPTRTLEKPTAVVATPPVVRDQPTPFSESSRAVSSPRPPSIATTGPTRELPTAKDRNSSFIPRENPVLAAPVTEPKSKLASSFIEPSIDRQPQPVVEPRQPIVVAPAVKPAPKKAELVENRFFSPTPKHEPAPSRTVIGEPASIASTQAAVQPARLAVPESQPSRQQLVAKPTQIAPLAEITGKSKPELPVSSPREKQQLSSLGAAITTGERVANLEPTKAKNTMPVSERPLETARPLPVRVSAADKPAATALPPILTASEFAANKAKPNSAASPTPRVAARDMPADNGGTGLKGWITTSGNK